MFDVVQANSLLCLAHWSYARSLVAEALTTGRGFGLEIAHLKKLAVRTVTPRVQRSRRRCIHPLSRLM